MFLGQPMSKSRLRLNANMNNDYDTIEEELKEESEVKQKTHKVSGRTVFKLQEIIKDKAGEEKSHEKEKSPKEN